MSGGYDSRPGERIPPPGYKGMVDPFNKKPPEHFKYIWLMFRGLNERERAKAPLETESDIRFNSALDETTGTSNSYVGKYEELTPKPTTYDDWFKYFTYTDPTTRQHINPTNLPREWSYAKSTNPFNQNPSRYGGGHSLQKSRFKKRKSRKYKSIKKSKKRSFKKRSGRY